MFMGFSQQEYWSGLPFPPPGDLPDPGIKPRSPVLASGFFTTEPPGKPDEHIYTLLCLKWITNKDLPIAHETLLNVLWHLRWEGNLGGESGYMYMYG